MEGVIYRVSGTRANGCRSREQLTKDSGEGRKAESDANHTVGPLTDRERIVAGVATSLLELSSS